MDKKKNAGAVFWFMLAAGGLWMASVGVSYAGTKRLDTGNAVVAVVLTALAFLFKFQQKI